MRLIEGIASLKGFPAEIPGCSRDELPEFLAQTGRKIGVEIGVHKGEYTRKLCKAGLKVSAIDPWVAFRGQGRSQNVQDNQDQNYAYAQAQLAPYFRCSIIRAKSIDAVRQFARDSLDFIYIDGDHTLISVVQDIMLWNRKVRSGGIISGHDYFCTQPGANNVLCHVKPAVLACAEVLGIQNFYIFGRNPSDRWHSWLWIKP